MSFKNGYVGKTKWRSQIYMSFLRLLYQLTKIQVIVRMTSQTTNEGVCKFISIELVNTPIHVIDDHTIHNRNYDHRVIKQKN